MIQIKSPTRVDLAGGTLDMWPLHNFVGQARTINVAIDIYTKATLVPRNDKKIILNSKDLNLTKTYEDRKACLSDTDSKLSLLQSQISYWHLDNGFELTTESESPVGGGLGGSSSLTITLLKAFNEWLKVKKWNAHQMVNVAHHIEAEILRTPTGTQDYYPAVSGGMNILSYTKDGIEQKTLSIPVEFGRHFMLAYTGKAHHSGLNNFQVLSQAVAGDKKTLGALHQIKNIADELYEVCIHKKWEQVPRIFNEEYKARIQLAEAFTSPEIEKLSQITKANGAEAIKICGAGGGGCVLVWCDPDHQAQVKAGCEKEGFKILSAKPVDIIV